MKHIRYFLNSQTIGGEGVKVDLPNVSYLEGENTLFISGNKGQATVIVNNNTGEIEVEKPDYSQMYLTFEAIESGTFKFSGATSAHTLSYSLDDGTTWTSLAHDTDTPIINAGNKIMWKGNLTPHGTKGIGKFVATGKFDAYGNIMSLLYGDNFVGQTSLTGKTDVFSYLFSNNTKVVSALNLILPATTLTSKCYWYMFQGCTSLTTGPALPATTLAKSCYGYMFYGCTSLTTAPELPATTLAEGCYSSMFRGCTSLTTTPELPATTLAKWCYDSMFYGCTSLTTAPELPATTLAGACYDSMFRGCTSLTTAPELPAATLANYCYAAMFNGCTSLTTAPALPATTLASNCYSFMFDGCTSLTTAPELPATTLATYCYHGMFYGCTSLTTAPELPAITLAYNCYANMFYDCTSLAYLKMLCGNDNEATQEVYNNSNKTGALYIYDNELASNDAFLNQFGGWQLYLFDVYIGIIEAKHEGYYE